MLLLLSVLFFYWKKWSKKSSNKDETFENRLRLIYEKFKCYRLYSFLYIFSGPKKKYFSFWIFFSNNFSIFVLFYPRVKNAALNGSRNCFSATKETDPMKLRFQYLEHFTSTFLLVNTCLIHICIFQEGTDKIMCDTLEARSCEMSRNVTKCTNGKSVTYYQNANLYK